LSGVTAILAIAKLLLKFPEKIRRSEEMLGRYKSFDFDLERLTRQIRERKIYDEELKAEFSLALDKKAKLLQADKESEPDEKLLNECYEKVGSSRKVCFWVSRTGALPQTPPHPHLLGLRFFAGFPKR